MAEKKFEESLKNLEKIVHQLEQGDVPIDESIKLFKDGLKLATNCKTKLKSAESEIQKIVKDSDGDFQLTFLS